MIGKNLDDSIRLESDYELKYISDSSTKSPNITHKDHVLWLSCERQNSFKTKKLSSLNNNKFKTEVLYSNRKSEYLNIKDRYLKSIMNFNIDGREVFLFLFCSCWTSAEILTLS